MRKVFKVKTFSRWMRKTELSDELLLEAVKEIERGLVDANLGGNIYKKRIALPPKGKSGGARVIIATRLEDRWFFLYGFRKNEQANISHDELEALKLYSKYLLGSDEAAIERLLEAKDLEEINNAQTK